MASQMLYNENNIFGIDTIFLIVDFYLNTSSCTEISRSDGISILKDEDLAPFYNLTTTYINMSAPPNIEIAILKYFIILKLKAHMR